MQINPSINQFVKLAKNKNLIVLSHKFCSDWLNPVSIYDSLRKKLKGESFLLESVEGVEKVCRFSFLGFVPLASFRSKGKEIFLKEQNYKEKKFITTKDPLFELKKIMSQYQVGPKENLRFFGGFVGYVGYDSIKFYEPVKMPKKDSLNVDDLYFVLPKYLIIFDHFTKQLEILNFVLIKDKVNLKNVYLNEKKSFQKIVDYITSKHILPVLKFLPGKLSVRSNYKKQDFLSAVKKAKQYIQEGEIIQVVLSQRFVTSFKKDPFTAYRYLRILNPSPYMFFLDYQGVQLAGSSPEMLLRCENGELVTRPIAGTRKRGKTEAEDKKLEESLLSDHKERAEHVMLVDLARNDLGRVAERASVTLPIFMSVERFSHVMHIVSEVRAKLKKKDLFSALISCFPAGTLSGAPKVRAMQIISELEPECRGIYGGSVGYFSFTKSLDTGIIIRTIVFKGNKAYVQAGAGIVNDSNPEKEFQETINKAKAQLLALKLAQMQKL